MKKQYLAVCLRGQACNILLSIPEESKTNYHCFVDALTKRLNPGDKTELFRIQLRNTFRRDQESLPQLAQLIRNLAGKAYPEAKGSLLEILCKDHFLDALDDPDMRFKVFQSKPASLDEAVGLAVEMEVFKQAEKHRPGGNWRKNVREIGIGNKSDIVANKETVEVMLQDMVGRLTTSINEIRQEVRELKEAKAARSQDFRCWNCGELGHNRRNCLREQIGDGLTYRPRSSGKDRRSNYPGLAPAANSQSQKPGSQF